MNYLAPLSSASLCGVYFRHLVGGHVYFRLKGQSDDAIYHPLVLEIPLTLALAKWFFTKAIPSVKMEFCSLNQFIVGRPWTPPSPFALC